MGGEQASVLGARETRLKNIYLFSKYTPTLTTSRAIVLLSRAALLRQYALWQAHLPFIRPFYAVKSNPDPHLLRWMRQIGKTDSPNQGTGCGVDCASPAEMQRALAAGFQPSDILYANPLKAKGDLKAAMKLGVRRTTIDSVEGAEQLQAHGENMEAIVRIAVDDAGSRSPFSVKFGAQRDEWRQVINAMRYCGIRFGGVSFHVGSASGSTTAWGDAIRRCREFQQVCGLTRIPTLDIGGGFLPNGWHFAQAAQGIVQALADWRTTVSPVGSPPESVIAEPGRFFSAPVETLIVPIIFKKESTDRVRYVLDDSVYGQFSNIVFDHSKPAWRLWNNHRQSVAAPKGTKQALFFGRTCDSLDLIATQDNAPQYKVGDRLVFPWMGAYTSASATRFNGFELPKRVYLEREGGPWAGMFEEAGVAGEDHMVGVHYPIETVSNIPLSVLCGGAGGGGAGGGGAGAGKKRKEELR